MDWTRSHKVDCVAGSSPVPHPISGYAQVPTQCSWKLLHGSSCRASAVAAGSSAYADVLAWSRKSNASLLNQIESVSVFSSMVYSTLGHRSSLAGAVYIRQGNSKPPPACRLCTALARLDVCAIRDCAMEKWRLSRDTVHIFTMHDRLEIVPLSAGSSMAQTDCVRHLVEVSTNLARSAIS